MTNEIRSEAGAADLVAFRARQKARNRVMGLILIALAILFFAITIVKIATPPPKAGASSSADEMVH